MGKNKVKVDVSCMLSNNLKLRGGPISGPIAEKLLSLEIIDNCKVREEINIS